MAAPYHTIPSEASVYAAGFRKKLRDVGKDPAFAKKIAALPPPTIILEELSHDTESNVAGVYKRAQENGWGHVGILTNVFHDRRVRVFTDHIESTATQPIKFTVHPGESWALHAFGEPQALKHHQAYLSYDPTHRVRSRFGIERMGEQDLQKGSYTSGKYK